jgi:ribose/xylose/arabinose/galactoside ABC-type transport system permease subunit
MKTPNERRSTIVLLKNVLWDNPVLLLVVIIPIALAIIYQNTFLSPSNLRSILSMFAVTTLLALGPSFVVIIGGLDLSYVGVWMAGGVLVWLLKDILGLFAIFVYPAIGLGVGCLNGVIQVKAKTPSFILTLSMLTILSSMAPIVTLGLPKSVPEYAFIVTPLIPNIPTVFLLSIPLIVVAIFLAKFTKIGTYFYAIGSNEEGAQQAGINVNKYKMLAFILSGVFSGIGSIFLFAHYGTQSPIALDMSRDVVGPLIAIVLGGTPLVGGLGGTHKTIVGALAYVLVYDAAILSGIDPFALHILVGLILLASVIVSSKGLRGVIIT